MRKTPAILAMTKPLFKARVKALRKTLRAGRYKCRS